MSADRISECGPASGPAKVLSPRPVFNTLEVKLLTDNSKSWIPIYPLAREPTPFETEVRIY